MPYAVDGLIDDVTPALDKVFSSQEVADRLVALKDEILGGASPAYDTLLELQQALEATDVTGLLTAIGNRVRFRTKRKRWTALSKTRHAPTSVLHLPLT